MDGRGMHASSHTWVPAFILVMKMHAVEGKKSVSLSFPFAVTVSAQKARLHVQGSRVPESVSDLRQEALSTALVAKAHSCCPHTPIPTASLKHRSAASPYFREIKPLVSAVTYLMA